MTRKYHRNNEHKNKFHITDTQYTGVLVHIYEYKTHSQNSTYIHK